MENQTLDILTAMAERMNDVFFIFDTNQLAFPYVNSSFEAVTQRKIQALFTRPAKLYDIIHQEDRNYVKQRLHLLLQNPTNSLLEFRILRADETERWIRLKIYPIVEGAEVRYITGIAEDDTARRVSMFNLHKVNGWKNANLEIISHDLRGPIGIVQMLSSVIGKKMPENQEIQKLTQLIGEISQRNINLIQDVLCNEAIDTAASKTIKERHDVVFETRQAMEIYLKAQKELKKHIRFTHSHDYIYAPIDNMKYLQIVNNLVSNAIKFTKDHGIIKIHLEQLENHFLLTVSDNGIGIPKKLQPIVFKRYTAAGRKGVEGEESIGLGMWIIKTHTEAHEGKVWFESEPEKGTTFYIEIPTNFH